ncbi:hypothetical protein [Lelliottia sp. CFBP8978]|uniref:hypothetical protein n=1 Tax=Lelliottia sp. CFBP8978 TaxID=3096522 RepID=UPI002A6B16E1|nr:hypothetical protein [Lelliottia sp. CFBP8978]MDY1038670.1 hypothetical protein [Lelliottia sp. CFBP8978]
MKKLLFLLIIPCFCFASEPNTFKSSCGGIQYKIESFCKANYLKDDQDKLDIPVCKKQVISLEGIDNDLSKATGFVDRISQNGEKVKMMNFVFYGASCKNDRLILSGSGGCNSCGEMFKTFNLSGKEIKEDSGSLDLESMQEIIPDNNSAE